MLKEDLKRRERLLDYLDKMPMELKNELKKVLDYWRHIK